MPSLFIQRNPDMNREEALQQAREFLKEANPASANEDENFNLFLQAAGLFIMYGSTDNELGMAGAEEMYQLAHKLRELRFDALLCESILFGLVIPNLNENNELTIAVDDREEIGEEFPEGYISINKINEAISEF
jgi:hypothetical protein